MAEGYYPSRFFVKTKCPYCAAFDEKIISLLLLGTLLDPLPFNTDEQRGKFYGWWFNLCMNHFEQKITPMLAIWKGKAIDSPAQIFVIEKDPEEVKTTTLEEELIVTSNRLTKYLMEENLLVS